MVILGRTYGPGKEYKNQLDHWLPSLTTDNTHNNAPPRDRDRWLYNNKIPLEDKLPLL